MIEACGLWLSTLASIFFFWIHSWMVWVVQVHDHFLDGLFLARPWSSSPLKPEWQKQGTRLSCSKCDCFVWKSSFQIRLAKQVQRLIKGLWVGAAFKKKATPIYYKPLRHWICKVNQEERQMRHILCLTYIKLERLLWYPLNRYQVAPGAGKMTIRNPQCHIAGKVIMRQHTLECQGNDVASKKSIFYFWVHNT